MILEYRRPEEASDARRARRAVEGLLKPLASGLLLLATGCLSVTLEPDPPDVPAGAPLPARVEYHGNPEYLPATVVEAAPDRADPPAVVYRTETRYRNSSPLHIFNPLLSFGYPGIGADVHVSGRLELRAGAEPVKVYAAECTVKMRRSVWRWNGPSQTELRTRGLVAVRESIEAQMLADAASLEALRGEGER